uniref:Uncharacterized protein n=1 Tax=Glossina pallidipes TaxID=7398 RepID=A0A1A9ZIM0_GLOPL
MAVNIIKVNFVSLQPEGVVSVLLSFNNEVIELMNRKVHIDLEAVARVPLSIMFSCKEKVANTENSGGPCIARYLSNRVSFVHRHANLWICLEVARCELTVLYGGRLYTLIYTPICLKNYEPLGVWLRYEFLRNKPTNEKIVKSIKRHLNTKDPVTRQKQIPKVFLGMKLRSAHGIRLLTYLW